VHMENIVKGTLGIKDHRIVKIDGGLENIVIHIAAITRRHLPCGVCGKRAKRVDRVGTERNFLHVPLWGIAVLLRYRPWRVNCPIVAYAGRHFRGRTARSV